MKIVGMHYSTKPDGQQSNTLHVLEEFNEYYKDAASGRGCDGMNTIIRMYAGNVILRTDLTLLVITG